MKTGKLVGWLLCLLFGMDVGTAFALHRIPTLYIETKDRQAVVSRDVWKEGTMVRLVLPDGYTAYESSDVAVKSRGHSTFDKPKKPYVFKLPAKAGLLGMPEGRKWILLANFMDHSNVRNSLALEVARKTALDWTPEWRFVDVVLNGRLQGLYTLVEPVDVKKRRLNLDADNGFLVEFDHYDDEPMYYTAVCRLPYHIKYPDPVPDSVRKGIERRVDGFEKFLYGNGNTGLSPLHNRCIDLDSFADWWIVHELTLNAEPNGPRSCYVHDRGDGRLRMGPVWDFDLAFIPVGLDDDGNIRPPRFKRPGIRLLTVDSVYNGNAMWYARLLEDSVFKGRVAVRWRKLKPRFAALLPLIRKWEVQIRLSAEDNDRIWKGQDRARFDPFDDFHASIEYVRQVYVNRLAVMDWICR